MWWDEATRQWKRHPMCDCDHDPCYCLNLPMLDEKGKPIGEYGVLGPDHRCPARTERLRKQEEIAGELQHGRTC